MMDFSQGVYDRLSDETLENDGEALYEKISSYGRTFIAVKAQQCVEWPEALGKSTHIEIRDVGGRFSVSFI